jgi:hypothetical protein
MISNDRPSPYGNRSRGSHSGHPHSHSPSQYHAGHSPKPPTNEETLRSEKLQIERKTFLFALKENPRGRFLRITEDVGGRRDTIIIPAPGLEEFRKLLDEMAKTSDETPPKTEPQQD